MRLASVLCLSTLMSGAALAEGADWTGFYAGVHTGYGFGQNRVADDNPIYFYEIEPDGLIAGGQLGYNHQFGSFVVGIEADATVGDIDTRQPYSLSFDEVALKFDYLASIRLRAGYAAGNGLYYVTGGVGFASWSDHTYISGVEFGTGADHNRTGWTLGAGAEFIVTGNWTAKVEYLHYGFDDEIQPPSMFWFIGADHFETSFDTVKVGLNYRF